MYENRVKIELASKSSNEGFARVSVAAFVAQLDPTVEEITDIKTAVSEAVTNSIIHGYEGKEDKVVVIEAKIVERKVYITVSDDGKGIDDVEKAMEPLYTSRPDLERSGMGFTVMQSFMDEVSVKSSKGDGTKVFMSKTLSTLK